MLGNGAGTVSRVALPRVLAAASRLREMLNARARLYTGQPHCHPLEWDEIAGSLLLQSRQVFFSFSNADSYANYSSNYLA